MRQFLLAFFSTTALFSFGQNVGIGTTIPTAALHVVRPADTALLTLENQTALAANTNLGLYFKNGSYFTGALKTIGNGVNTSRISLYTFADGSQNNLKERLSILDNGNVGIGTNSPTAKLHVAGSLKLIDGTQGVNKVLTSDATGGASWKASAYGNTERFFFEQFYTFSGGGALTTLYNTGTATASIGSGSNTTNSREMVISFTKTGLYHFDINSNVTLTNSSSAIGFISFNMVDNINTRHFVNVSHVPLFSQGGSITGGNYDKGLDIYIDQPMSLTLSTSVYNGGNSFTLYQVIMSVSGYLIAD